MHERRVASAAVRGGRCVFRILECDADIYRLHRVPKHQKPTDAVRPRPGSSRTMNQRAVYNRPSAAVGDRQCFRRAFASLALGLSLVLAAAVAIAEEQQLPVREGQRFEVAHEQLIGAGWRRRPTHLLVKSEAGRITLGRLAGIAREFYFAGYAEVQECDTQAEPHCTFNYLGSGQRCLRLETVGRPVARARIARWGFDCPPAQAL